MFSIPVADERTKEIREAMKQDKGRLRPAQTAARQERQKWQAEAERLLKRGTEEEKKK